MKIITIVGARPQFIKAAVVSRAIAEHNDRVDGTCQLEEIIVHTGQHYDIQMSAVFFEEMQIPVPSYSLKVKAATHASMTGRMMEGIETVLLKELPDIVLVYGDTNSTLAGALAAVKLGIPVAHVEAGLRSYNMKMPEEINRILTDRISQWLFCPTRVAEDNLVSDGFSNRAGISKEAVVIANTGDVMYDAVLYYATMARPVDSVAEVLNDSRFYLATVHRAENTNDRGRLASIMRALDDISAQKPVIMPIHPRTRKLLAEYNISTGRIKVIDPVGYFEILWLLHNCRGVFTDSGGMQKEAYFFAKPCITLREETEWTELVEIGHNILVGADAEKIRAAERIVADRVIKQSPLLYGDGQAGEKIVRLLAKHCR